MELEVIAQLITGLATLVVAIVLLLQLRKQNHELDLQHQDSMREFNFQENQTLGDFFIEMMKDPVLAELYLRGSEDWNNLKGKIEKFRYRSLYNQQLNMLIFRWNNRDKLRNYEDSNSISAAKMLLSTPGQAVMYKFYARRRIAYYEGMRELWDKVYQDIWNENLENVSVPQVMSFTQFHDEK
tara:strand:- start:186 stop:734 length:549 start_codon:yes stop_codon:yes gene_type:complete